MRHHPWRSVLCHLRQKFYRWCEPSCRRYAAFYAAPDVRLYAPDGQRLWFVYGLGPSPDSPYWEARFLDFGLILEGANQPREFLPYAAIRDVSLPSASWPSHVVEVSGAPIIFDAALMRTEDANYPVFGAVDEQGSRDVCLWKAVVSGVNVDRLRQSI
ncbi:MAG: hypothetical protein HUU60_04010 [Armatimonadetes bacterium]|nr:hypothetical protein [Armatimonadota bacterium]